MSLLIYLRFLCKQGQQTTMAALQSHALLLLFLLISLSSVNRTVKCDDEEDNLFKGINKYRTSINLTALTKNDNAECFAEEMADQFKGQPCTNTTGSNTVPGTEPLFSNYPNLLSKCKLNITTTRDGALMPACAPNLEPSLVLSNYTHSQYSSFLNDTKYSGVGIGSEGNWVVVILTTNSPGGNFGTADNSDSDNSAASVLKIGSTCYTIILLMSFLFL